MSAVIFQIYDLTSIMADCIYKAAPNVSHLQADHSRQAFETWLQHQHRSIPQDAWLFASSSPGSIIQMLVPKRRQAPNPNTVRQLLGSFDNTVRRSKEMLPEAEPSFRKWLEEAQRLMSL